MSPRETGGSAVLHATADFMRRHSMPRHADAAIIETDLPARSPEPAYDGKQGFSYFEGIAAETVGSTGICMHLLTIPPGGRAKAHMHESHETAIYVLSGETHTWYGERLENHVVVKAGEMFYIPAGVPHLPANLSAAGTAVIARTDPNEQESVVLLPELDDSVPTCDRQRQRPSPIAARHQTPVAGMPLRSTLRGAVISFQVDSARLTACMRLARRRTCRGRARVLTLPSSIATSPRVSV